MRKIVITAATVVMATLAIAMPASGSTSPSWLHVKSGPPHHGHPCVIVWGGNGDTSARVCKDGFAETS